MNMMQESEAIKKGLGKGFRDGSSKMTQRKCHGYEVGTDGELTVNPDEAQVVDWIFEWYLAGDSLWIIAAGLERQGILSPPADPDGIVKQLASYFPTKNILMSTEQWPIFA